MSRAHTKRPVWTWFCDRCGATSGDLAYQQSLLPSPAVMRERGWFIADRWGDLCSRCKEGVGHDPNDSRRNQRRGSDGMSEQDQHDSMITTKGEVVAYYDSGPADKALVVSTESARLTLALTEMDRRKLIVMLGGRP